MALMARTGSGLQRRLPSARFLMTIVKPAILWIIVIYILLQITTIFSVSDSHHHLAHGVRPLRSIVKSHIVQPKDSSNDTPSVIRAEAIVMATEPRLPKQNIIEQTTYRYTRSDLPLSSSCSGDVHILRGFQRQRKGYLTIGLTTVPRDKANYLPDTLNSLMENMLPDEKNKTVIVLYVSSLESGFINKTLKMVDSKFASAISSGILQVIQPSLSVFPDFSKITKRTFNDSMDRVHWRVKQNIDFAVLFSYCEMLSDYYIHVEDDIIAASGFIGEIKKVINRVSSPSYTQIWFELDFSSLGFIGRLYRSSDLCMMKKFLLLFQLEKPCDILMNDLKHVMMQPKDIKSPRALFQHVGMTSSLKGKVQKLTDRTFKDGKRGKIPPKPARKGTNALEKDLTINYKLSDIHNPIAEKIVTNMETFGDYLPERAYFNFEKGFYWAKTPASGSFYKIIYNVSTPVDAITIRTGHPKKFVDMLENGSVRIGVSNSSTAKDECAKQLDVGVFQRGQFYVHFNSTMQVNCIEIQVTKQMNSWMIISEITIENSMNAVTQSDEVPNKYELSKKGRR